MMEMEYYSDGQWYELLGHMCETKEHANEYLSVVGPFVRIKGTVTTIPSNTRIKPHQLRKHMSIKIRLAFERYLNA